jgi:hypothetical protein
VILKITLLPEKMLSYYCTSACNVILRVPRVESRLFSGPPFTLRSNPATAGQRLD